MKQFFLISTLLVTLLSTSISGNAHVTVKPESVKPGAFQTFDVGVANEKEIPTIKVRLVMPEGVEGVKPTQKIGWQINLKKEGEVVKEIEWASGTIPVGFREEFSFSAKSPTKEANIYWKAYQTYQDGSEVAWDQISTEKHSEKSDHKGDEKKLDKPASVTAVTAKDDSELKEEHEKEISTVNTQLMALWGVVILSLVISIMTLTVKNQSKNS
jgi:uncharacterized protein YcnI